MINKKFTRKNIGTKKWKSKKRKQVLRGGEDGDEGLFKPPKGSKNGASKCWINSPLYSILFHPDIKKAITEYQGNDAIIKKLKEFYGETYIWNNDSYVELLTVMIDNSNSLNTTDLKDLLTHEIILDNNKNKIIYDKLTKDQQYNLIEYIKTQKKSNNYITPDKYYDNGLIIKILIDVITNILNIDIRQIQSEIFRNNIDKINALDSISVALTCTKDIKNIHIGHFYSYVKHNNKWYKVDALNFDKREWVRNMIKELECEEENYFRNMTGFVINNPELFNKGKIFHPESDINCGYSLEHLITFQGQIKEFYKKNGETFQEIIVNKKIENMPFYMVAERHFDKNTLRCTYLQIFSEDNNIWVNVDDIIKVDIGKKEGTNASNVTKSGEDIDGTMVCP